VLGFSASPSDRENIAPTASNAKRAAPPATVRSSPDSARPPQSSQPIPTSHAGELRGAWPGLAAHQCQQEHAAARAERVTCYPCHCRASINKKRLADTLTGKALLIKFTCRPCYRLAQAASSPRVGGFVLAPVYLQNMVTAIHLLRQLQTVPSHQPGGEPCFSARLLWFLNTINTIGIFRYVHLGRSHQNINRDKQRANEKKAPYRYQATNVFRLRCPAACRPRTC